MNHRPYSADDRAMMSVNREIAFQQQQLAEKIRALKESLAEPIEEQIREAELFARRSPVAVETKTPSANRSARR